MKFDAILKYQDTDLRLRRIYDEIEKSDLNKRLEKAKSEFNAAKSQVEECGKTAEALIGNVATATKLYEEATVRLAELAAEAETADYEQSQADLIARLESLRNKLADLEKKLAEVKKRADRAIMTYRESNEQGKKMREVYARTKNELETLKKSREPEINALKSQLGSLSKDIEPNLMEQYNALIADGKVFAFVEAVPVDKDYSCRGCGISLSQTLKSELEEKGWCRCETCRRIVYKPEKK